MEEIVDVQNVCEFIQIAYANNFEALKQKCRRILVEKKNQINSNSIKQLPKEILFEAFCL